jgi:hypothetical protein
LENTHLLDEGVRAGAPASLALRHRVYRRLSSWRRTGSTWAAIPAGIGLFLLWCCLGDRNSDE